MATFLRSVSFAIQLQRTECHRDGLQCCGDVRMAAVHQSLGVVPLPSCTLLPVPAGASDGFGCGLVQFHRIPAAVSCLFEHIYTHTTARMHACAGASERARARTHARTHTHTHTHVRARMAALTQVSRDHLSLFANPLSHTHEMQFPLSLSFRVWWG